MRIEAMKDFILFSRILNFSKAANILNMSQPNLSYRIQQIENEVGHKLVERTPTPHLTENGLIFVDYAENIVNSYEEMFRSFNKISHVQKQPIIFEDPIIFDQTWLEIKGLCKEFTDLSGVEFKFIKSGTTFEDAIKSKLVDIGLTLTLSSFIDADQYDYGYMKLPLSEHPGVRFYLHRENPLARKTSIAKKDLDGAKIVLPLDIRYSVFDDTAKLFMEKEGIRFRIIHKPGSYQDIERNLKKDEMAFSMLDLKVRHKADNETRIVSRPADTETWLTDPYLIYNKDNSNPSLWEFLEFLVDKQNQAEAS